MGDHMHACPCEFSAWQSCMCICICALINILSLCGKISIHRHKHILCSTNLLSINIIHDNTFNKGMLHRCRGVRPKGLSCDYHPRSETSSKHFQQGNDAHMWICYLIQPKRLIKGFHPEKIHKQRWSADAIVHHLRQPAPAMLIGSLNDHRHIVVAHIHWVNVGVNLT